MRWDFPVFLDLRSRRCLVIGSGWTAHEKVAGLLRAGADVTLIAEQAVPEIEALAQEGVLKWERRDYRPGDLEGFFLAVSTHDDRSRNEPVWREAQERSILFNAVDDPPRCGFSYPAIYRQGDLAIAISTNGKCPALGVRIRQRLENEIGPEYGCLVETLGEMRDQIAARVPDFARRKELWYRLVDAGLAGAAPDELRAMLAEA